VFILKVVKVALLTSSAQKAISLRTNRAG